MEMLGLEAALKAEIIAAGVFNKNWHAILMNTAQRFKRQIEA